ncbi:coiled-coil domain-containing protein 9-like [Nilaparvata lugens]|uniref:coiled-coil domain-containing protein 9-like n=1 Tax=Nilaparvata lugens TaxID=108931 RepID=UPI00193E1CFF|nr:coiled-coil domain-containing protein 9-like [Nilaparvata lugens]
MASTADEEARRLDEKIAEIRRKNELILRRRKEIEDDKKLAEQQNAVVQLKPSTEDWPRERTPAMKPSKRDMAAANYSYQDTPPSRDSVRRDRPGTTSGSRGSELMEKGAGPPPDPRSFLSDPDRESSFGNSRDRPQTNRRDLGHEFRGKGAPQRENYDERGRGGGRRGGGRECVGGGERERGGGGGGNRERRNRIDENWREERHQIDEARVQRQKGPDGGWRREWDNEKMTFDVEGDDNKHPALTPTKTAPPKTGGLSSRLNRWRETDNKGTILSIQLLDRAQISQSVPRKV